MGRLKQLLPWGETHLLAWQVEQMRAAGADDVVVVLGHQAEAIRDAAGDLNARIVVNDAYQEGRASSLRCGAGALDEDVSAVLILGVDQPRPASVSRALVDRWGETGALLVMPAYLGRRGHPVLADGSLLPELRRVTEADLGLRAVTERHAASTDLVAIENESVILDLNTPADYETAYVMFSRNGWL
jgi:molybdenum cofactor cytidylyltransferase